MSITQPDNQIQSTENILFNFEIDIHVFGTSFTNKNKFEDLLNYRYF